MRMGGYVLEAGSGWQGEEVKEDSDLGTESSELREEERKKKKKICDAQRPVTRRVNGSGRVGCKAGRPQRCRQQRGMNKIEIIEQ